HQVSQYFVIAYLSNHQQQQTAIEAEAFNNYYSTKPGPIFAINMSNDSPRTPLQSPNQPEYDTGHRVRYFYDADRKPNGKTFTELARKHRIGEATARR
ncbi:hypothetical protein BU26DRAFT_515946, partial [Trematosphaeria pertusa]